MVKFWKFFYGILLRGESSDPSDNLNGSLWYNSTSNRLKGYLESAVREITTNDQTQTLTSKTVVVANNTVTTAASGNLTATELNAALAELQTDIDTRATSTDLTNHIADTTTHGTTGDIVGTSDSQTLTNKTISGASNTLSNIAYSSLVLSNSIVNADINASAAIAFSKLAALPSANILVGNGSNVATAVAVTGDVLISNAGVTSINTGVIVDADINATANIALSKLAALTTSRALQSNASTGFIEASSVTNTELGYLSGVTSSIQTQVDDKQSRSTLTTKGDLYAATASATVARVPVGTNGQVLIADSAQATGLSWGSPTANVLDQSYEISNLGLLASVSANALTIALKTKAGTDPSAGDQVKIGFRNPTLTTGTYTQESISSALSFTIPSGATMGHANSAPDSIYVYAVNTGSGIVLGASTAYFEDGTIQNTSASTPSTARFIYTSVAQTSKPVRLIGKIYTTQTTAGTWASAPTQVDLAPIAPPKRTEDRNLVLNGGFDIWQRNTSFAISGSARYCADRWYHELGSGIGHTVAQAAVGDDPLVKSTFAMRIQRNSGETTITGHNARYAAPNLDSAIYKGKHVVVSLAVKKSSTVTATNISCTLYAGTGTDQPNPSAFTGVTSLGATSVAMSSISSTQYTQLFFVSDAVPFNTTQLGIVIDIQGWNGLAGSNDYLDIAEVQIIEGTELLPFRPRNPSWQQELSECMKFWEKSYNYGIFAGANSAAGMVAQSRSDGLGGFSAHFKVPKRTSPTVLIYSYTGSASGLVRYINTGTDVAGSIFSAGETGIVVTSGSVPAGQAFAFHYTASSEFA